MRVSGCTCGLDERELFMGAQSGKLLETHNFEESFLICPKTYYFASKRLKWQAVWLLVRSAGQIIIIEDRRAEVLLLMFCSALGLGLH